MAIKTRTIRVPAHLDSQINDLAKINRRSYTSQVVLMLEQTIDGSVEADLNLMKDMRERGAKGQLEGSGSTSA